MYVLLDRTLDEIIEQDWESKEKPGGKPPRRQNKSGRIVSLGLTEPESSPLVPKSEPTPPAQEPSELAPVASTGPRRHRRWRWQAAPYDGDVRMMPELPAFHAPWLPGTLRGVVRWFNNKKGWGFLTCPSLNSQDVFVHINECDDTIIILREGDEVEFELSTTYFPEARVVRALAEKPPSARDWRGGRGIDSRPDVRRQRNAGPAAFTSLSKGLRIRVLNMPWTLGREKLSEAFEAVGEVLQVDLDEDRVGQAVITFSEPSAAQLAVETYDRGTLNDRQIRVRYED